MTKRLCDCRDTTYGEFLMMLKKLKKKLFLGGAMTAMVFAFGAVFDPPVVNAQVERLILCETNPVDG